VSEDEHAISLACWQRMSGCPCPVPCRQNSFLLRRSHRRRRSHVYTPVRASPTFRVGRPIA